MTIDYRSYLTWGATKSNAFYDWMKANYPETVRDFEEACEYYEGTLEEFVLLRGDGHIINEFQAQYKEA